MTIICFFTGTKIGHHFSQSIVHLVSVIGKSVIDLEEQKHLKLTFQ